jgi:hypothetical protein
VVGLPYLMMYPAHRSEGIRGRISVVGGTPDGRQVAPVPCIGHGGGWLTRTGVDVDRMAGTEPISASLWIPA